MKKIIAIAVVVFCTVSLKAQMLHPVKWNFSTEKSDKNELRLKFDADIEKEWHIYSQFTPDGGPLPMLFTYEPSACYELSGKTIEPAQIEKFDSVFAVKVLYLESQAKIMQIVDVKSKPCKITGKVEYQACKDACIAMDTTFTFNIK